MTLNISEIKNQKLKAIANNLDKDNNGKLNQEEFNLFKSVAINVTSAKAYNKACSLFKPEATEDVKADEKIDTVEVKEEPKAVEYPKSNAVQRERYITDVQNTLMRYMGDTRKHITLDTVVDELRGAYKGDAYAQTMDNVQKIVDTIKGMKIDSKDDVKEIKKTLRETDGINMYAYRNIITLVEQIAENDQIQREGNVVKGIYDEVVAKNPDVTNIEKRFEIIEEKLEELGLKDKSYYSGKATKVAKDYAVGLAKGEIKAANEADKDYTDADSKQKADIEAAKDDKYTKKAAKESTADYGVNARWNKYEQRGETIEAVTLDEINENLPKSLVRKLEKAYLSKENRNEDGTYNFKKLYDAIGQRMGADAWVMKSESEQMNEYKHIKDDFEALGIEELTEKELKELIDFCGGTVAPKDRTAKTAAKEGAKNIGLGALIGLLNGHHIDLEQTMQFTLKTDTIENFVADLEKAGYDIEELKKKGLDIDSKNGRLRLHQELLTDTHLVTTIAGAIEGFAAGFLATVIFGKERLEGDCVSLSDFTINDSKYTNYEEYKKYITEKHPAVKANALLAIVEEFKKEDGTIDVAAYNSYLNEIAGIGSKLNCLELEYAGRGKKSEQPAPPVLNDDIDIEDEDINSATVHQEEKPEVKIGYHKHETKARDTWEGIVKQYYPELVAQYGLWGKNGAIKQLQRAMSTKNGVFDADAFRTLINQSNLKKELNIPTQILIGDVTYDIQYNERVQGHFVEGGDKNATFGGYANVTFGFKNGDYVATCDQTNKTATGKTKEEALANLKEITGLEYDIVSEY